MRIPFLSRPSIRQIIVGTSDEAGKKAHTLIQNVRADLPEMLMACVVEVHSGKVLASYTTSATLNPNQVSLRYAKLLRQTSDILAKRQIPGGALTDMTMMLEDQLHTLRPLRNGQWYCYLAIRFADANLAIALEVLRRHSNFE
ncbi:hypothetical protein DNI29_04135 [Hymenobacter sediminis]|uniref:hypothetical protein n=1 Tax=Hymenobacter sediminis TaxID=2218621 RepID=UPI000DA66860|nr:hypothetical protein [Hymenobacter sediminis]RPD49992.1 hypothetical protein DNI29_04135 [Hymenobacter sediminis]